MTKPISSTRIVQCPQFFCTVLLMSPEFKINLAELETRRPTMCKSIEADGKPL